METFTYKNLKKILVFLKKNREITTFKDYKGNNAAILRHDVDLSIKKAYKVAKLEKSMGIRSSFFFLVSSLTYNIFTKDNQKMIKDIAKWGFEIGLHFSPSAYQNHLDNKMCFESEILEKISGQKIKTVSLHNPSITKRFNVKGIKLQNVYDTKFFSKEYYASDSLRYFKKDIYRFIEETNDHVIQILLHPLHFDSKTKDYTEIFSDFLEDFSCQIDTDFRVNSGYDKEVKPNLLSCFLKQKSSRNEHKK